MQVNRLAMSWPPKLPVSTCARRIRMRSGVAQQAIADHLVICIRDQDLPA